LKASGSRIPSVRLCSLAIRLFASDVAMVQNSVVLSGPFHVSHNRAKPIGKHISL
jgi:hypothetical protein